MDERDIWIATNTLTETTLCAKANISYTQVEKYLFEAGLNLNEWHYVTCTPCNGDPARAHWTWERKS